MGKRTRLKFLRVGYWRVAIPGANILTNVAAKYVLTHGLAKLIRNCFAQLDGQVRNALSRVHDVGFDQRVCRTRVDAFAAGAAAVRWGKIRNSQGRRQLEAG